MTIYLDYNSTSPLCRQAMVAMQEAMQFIGNPSSVHKLGRQIRQKLEQARRKIAEYIEVSSQRIIFTSGATESNNLALTNFPGRIILSAIEHDSIRLVRSDAQLIAVSEAGVVDLENLDWLLSQPYEGPSLVSVMIANNETGVIQPLKDIISIAKKYNAFVHSDIVQGIGRLDFPWQDLDMMSISSHKFGGPTGVGCLVVHPDCPLKPLFRGGGQERFYRPGTENMIGIVGMSEALVSTSTQDWLKVKIMRDNMERSLLTLNPKSIIIGQRSERLANTTLVTMPGVKSETQVMNLDLAGFCVSSGSACSSGKVKVSHVLKAMQVSDIHQMSALRISLTPYTTDLEVESFVQAWHKVYTQCPSQNHLTFPIDSKTVKRVQANVHVNFT
jgi:cysteine desulfurase